MSRFLDLADPSFDVTGEEVLAARAESSWARTSYGYAVLRHAEVTALLKDRRFRQGNARWPAQNGISSGLFSDWWHTVLLSLEGEDHLRLRRLLNPAFKQGAVTPMVPGFTELAHELVGRSELRRQAVVVNAHDLGAHRNTDAGHERDLEAQDIAHAGNYTDLG